MQRGTILITGATGFVGQAVVPRFLDAGFRVRGLLRPSSTWPFAAHKHLERVVGDMGNRASLERACRGVSGICHLAAAKADEAWSVRTNTEGTRNLCQAAEKHGVHFIVNISTQSARLLRRGVYGTTKADADAIFSSASVPVVTLYPSLVFGGKGSGAFETLWRMSRLPIIPLFGQGNAVYYPIHRHDLAELIVRIASEGGGQRETYDAGGPEAITLLQLLRRLAASEGRSLIFLPIPVILGLLLARILSLFPNPPFTVSNVLGGAEAVALDSTPLYRRAGYTPSPLSAILTEEVALLKAPTLSDPLADELTLLTRYILPKASRRWKPGPGEIDWYRQALLGSPALSSHHFDNAVQRWPFLLGGLDAITKRLPNSPVQKKLLIAATMVECHPVSAGWLLPRNRSVVATVALLLQACTRACGKMLLGIVLLSIPGFTRHHASSV